MRFPGDGRGYSPGDTAPGISPFPATGYSKMSSVANNTSDPLFSRPVLILIFITMLWGGTFLIVHHAVQVSGAFFFVGLRFGTAALILSLFSLKTLRGASLRDWIAGGSIGLAIAIGYGLQTLGMKTISSSQSAFITAMYVPLVPLLQWLFFRRPPGIMSWCGIVLAFAGLLLLSGVSVRSASGFSAGEMVTLASTLAIAAEILLIGYFAGTTETRRLTLIQLLMASLFSFLFMLPAGEAVPDMTMTVLGSACGLGLASAVIQLTMNWAQRSVSPTKATIIYAGEPVWAGIVGRIAGERLPLPALAGGCLIVCAVVISELRWKKKKLPAADV